MPWSLRPVNVMGYHFYDDVIPHGSVDLKIRRLSMDLMNHKFLRAESFLCLLLEKEVREMYTVKEPVVTAGWTMEDGRVSCKV